MRTRSSPCATRAAKSTSCSTARRKTPTYAVVELDGEPVPKSARGKSIVERDGQTIVDIDAADLYGLIKNGPKGDHTLTFHPGGAGVQAYAFTFGT